MARASASRALADLIAAEWAWRRRELAGADAEDAPALPADHLPRVDAAAQARRGRRWQATLAALDALDVAPLAIEERLNLAVYRHTVESLAADARLGSWQMPLNAEGGFWTDLRHNAEQVLADPADAERYCAWLADLPRYFTDQTANLRLGLARGFTQPRAILGGHAATLAAIGAVRDERHPLLAPLVRFAAAHPGGPGARRLERGLALLERAVLPAHARLADFLAGSYLPGARTSLAACALPDGAAWYRAQIRKFTTLDLAPEAIHARGLEEVARLRALMTRTMREAGFDGDIAAFTRRLRARPQLYATDGAELIARAEAIVARIRSVLGRCFGRLPRQGFRIAAMPPELAEHGTSGRGGAGYYLLNTSHLDQRPLHALTALTLHEAIPGHALQMPLAAEREDLPAFRRQAQIAAWTEGWALYAETLGVEMGLYATPEEHFGYLDFQMWRACRLVLDTGIHHYGWSRERARAYLAAHTALGAHEIGTEIDRYIGWPGQALAYYLGELAFLDARAHAEQALGAAFDRRAFHDAVLATGPLPLTALALVARRFVAARQH